MQKRVRAVKIIVVKSPRFLSGILRLLFGIKKQDA
ncbi:MAG: stage V sporulation protein SpoVM [Acetanaerobacterium sp.]